MKMLRYLLALALIPALSSVAHADDFQMIVIDPPTPIPADRVNPIYSTNFTVNFPTSGPAAGCDTAQLPGVSDPQDYFACFTGLNLTGTTLTSLSIEFPVFTLPGQTSVDTPSCPTVGTADFPTQVYCGFTNNKQDYLIELAGGNILPAVRGGDCDHDHDGGDDLNRDDIGCNSASIFTIAVGVPGVILTPAEIQQDFNTNDVANANTITTPEPSSLLLLSTGFFSVGLFGVYRRRGTLVASPPSSKR